MGRNRARPGVQPDDQRHQQSLQRVHLGDHGLRPDQGRGAEGQPGGDPGRPAPGRLRRGQGARHRPVDQGGRQRGQDGGQQVGAEGQRAERQQLEAARQQQVERVAGRVGHAPGRGGGDQVAPVGAPVGPGQARRQGAQVQAQQRKEQERGGQAFSQRPWGQWHHVS